ncbi:MAG: lamin tail domain-containing protein [Candidatus Neomarinimicrobiota bacterium]
MRLVFFLLFFGILNASSVRFMTYNLLNYQDDNDREDDYSLIIEYTQPNIMIVQEVIGEVGYSNFKSDVLDVIGPDIWSGAPFINQTAQQDIALFYNHDIFSFIGTSTIYTAQSSGTRDVIEWVLIHDASGIEFNIYGVHLKASSGNSNADQRLEEATILRQHLNEFSADSYFIVGGDFNIYSNNSSSEPAFDMLTSSSNDSDGQLFDPINRIGHWHNNSSYADVHTQSPRTSSFGGGANGGMDDRFDWLFVSQALLDGVSSMHYIEDTYWAFGNDGNHFNDAINNGNNNLVSDEMADALHDASDHLPVYMDVWFDDLTYSDEGIIISEVMVNPSSVSDSYGEWFEIMNMTDTTVDIQGWSIKDMGEDEHTFFSDQMSISIPPGDFFVLARNGDSVLNGGLVPDYDYDDFSLANGDDQIILIDESGAIVDEVHYSEDWAFSSGVSMEIHDPLVDNSLISNWFSSTIIYGSGDQGSPGIAFNGSLESQDMFVYPRTFEIISLYPNPFNPLISIKFQNHIEEHLMIEIIDVSGHSVFTLIDAIVGIGEYNLIWDAGGHSSGIYFFKIKSGNSFAMRKALFIK